MARQTDQYLRETLTYLGTAMATSQHAWSPNTDVFETCSSLIVRMELAGIRHEDLEITLTDRLLVVRGHRREPCRQGRCTFRQMEIDYGEFQRRIVIPSSVDASRVRAQLDHGFLHIELPKAERSDPRAITVIIEQLG